MDNNKDSMSSTISFLIKNYDGEQLIEKMLEETLKNRDFKELLLLFQDEISSLLVLMKEYEDNVYYDGIVTVFSKCIHDAKKKYKDKEFFEYVFSHINVIEEFISDNPDCSWAMALLMTLLDKVAEFSVMEHDYENAVHFYTYQRNRLIDFSDIIDIRKLISAVDRKMVLPMVFSGQQKEARMIAEEAYSLSMELFQEAQNTNADGISCITDIIDICANLSGIYLDANELDNAERILKQGLSLWNNLPLNIRDDINNKSIEMTLKSNIDLLATKKAMN